MKIKEMSLGLKIKYENGKTKTFEIGEYVFIYVKNILKNSIRYDGILTGFNNESVRITDFVGNDYTFEWSYIEEFDNA